MEVHHHAHPATGRRRWTHYFWEFLMLFLAVFCGFLAENFREHQVEKKRAKEYIYSMIEDLKTDTASFSESIILNSANQLRMDSLEKELADYKWGNSTINVYYLARRITYLNYRVQYNNRTFEQLKNSGGLRLIHYHHVLDSISQYYESLRWMDVEIAQKTDFIDKLISANEELFDAGTMTAISRSGFIKPEATPPLFQNDRLVLNKYLTRLGYFKAIDHSLILKINDRFLPTANRLIRMLKSQYHIE